jgi:hypothetical protein
VLCHGLPPGLLNTMQQNQLVHIRHKCTVAVVVHTVNVGVWWQRLFERY